MTTTIGNAAVNLTANLDGLDAGMEAAAKAVESTTARMNRAVATTGRIGDRFDALEGKVKAVSRTFNDARGALELFGASGTALAPIASKIGGVADAFGSLTAIFRGGALSAGGGLAAVVPILGAVVTAATTAYGAYQLFAGSTEDASKAQKELDDALAFAEARMRTASEQALELEMAERRQALASLEAAKAIQTEAAAQLQADREFAAAALAEAQAQGARPARRGTLRQGLGQSAAQGLAADLAVIDQALAAAQAAAQRTEAAIGAVLRPQAVDPARSGGSSAAAQVGELEAALDRAAQGLGQQRLSTAQLEAGRRVLEETVTPAERYAARMAELNDLLAAGAINQETFNRAVDAANGTLGAQESKVAGLSKDLTVYGDAIGNAFGEAVLRGRELDDVLKNLANTLAQQIFRQTVGNQITSGISGLLGGVFGGGLKGFAGGGRTPVGEWFTVGEQGPELMKFDTPGTVLPNGVSPGNAGGGYTDARVYNIDARNSTLSAAQIAGIVRAASDDAIARVPDLARRGGAFSRDTRGRR